MRRSSCGGLHARVAGARVTLRTSGAAWLIASRALIVADLHFEKGSAYGVRGQLLPPYDTRDTLYRIKAEVEQTAPDILVFLGDSFHDGEAESRLDPQDAALLVALATGRRLIWVVGNHDADGPRALPGEVVATLELDGLLLTHEPSDGHAPGEVAGHLHPAAKVVSHARSVRSRCFVTDGERLILPAFGAYAGGLNVRDRAFDGLFAREPVACALGRGRVHALAWPSLIGD
ncbi:MAG: ligase-associated DNA damage response endonuclease PdeM [Proteobacteria bacterium]|nr:ligase-associated DNA damage response endonuclease PdeM [Pseudomonadota bacterium]